MHKNVNSLPDYIDYQLKILSVGLNPSIPSVEKGFYFANPRNRFWKAFNRAKIINTEIIPDNKIHKHILEQYLIGFTDVAKRPSRMGHELRADDFKRDAPILRKKIEQYMPELVWFHGKVAVSKFMQYGYGIKNKWNWGFNEVEGINSQLYISPNPSPANAAYSLDDLTESYKNLRFE